MESKPPHVKPGPTSQPGAPLPTERRPALSRTDQPPRLPTARLEAQQATRRLGAAFAQEPELISACLEGAAHRPPGWAKRILSAAELALVGRPDYADLNYHASCAALAAGEYETAARLLEQALRVNPAYHDALVLAARLEIRRGRACAARRRLEAALACGADYPDVHTLLGDVCRQEGDCSRARQSYERALALNGSLAEARAALAELPPAPAGRKP